MPTYSSNTAVIGVQGRVAAVFTDTFKENDRCLKQMVTLLEKKNVTAVKNIHIFISRKELTKMLRLDVWLLACVGRPAVFWQQKASAH